VGNFLEGGDPVTPDLTLPEFYVEPSGKGIGTQLNPTNLEAVLSTGKDINMLDGVHQIDVEVNVPANVVLKAVSGARPIITRSDNKPPRVHLNAGTMVNGIWFGGSKETVVERPITLNNDATIQDCTFFGYYGGIAEGGNSNHLFEGNRFINCGTAGHYHDLYISGDTHAKIYDNIFIGGEGYKIHLWHEAANADIQGNFVAECLLGLVLQHSTNQAINNIFWNDTVRPMSTHLIAGMFLHNLFGHRTDGTGKWDHQMNGGEGDLGLTVDRCGYIGDRYLDTTTWPGSEVYVGPYNGDGHVLPAAGTNYIRYAVEDLPALLGYSEAQIDAAVEALEQAFAQTVQQIHDDSTIETHFATLKAVVDAWKLQ
jgi:hypothetical protein